MLINYVFKIRPKDQLRWMEIQILFLLVFFLHFMYLFCLCFCVCGHICVTAHMWSQFSHSLTWVLGIELGSVAFIPLSRLGSQPSFRFFRQVVQADTSASRVLGFHGCATLKGFILFLSLVCIFLIPITQIS